MKALITSFKLKTKAWGNSNYYSHTIFFEDGSSGELYQCTDPNPKWLKENIMLDFNIKPGKYENLPFIIPLKADGELILDKNLVTQKKSSWVPRIEDIPEYWLKKQKFIGILSSLERATELVCAGKLDKNDLHKFAKETLAVILEQAGMNDGILEKEK